MDHDPNDFPDTAPPGAVAPPSGRPRDRHEPPHDETIERALLGACILSTKARLRALPLVKAEDFYLGAHRTLWEVLTTVRGDADVTILATALRARAEYNAIGGAQWVAELTDGVQSVAHVEAHARTIAALAAVRRTQDAARLVIAQGYGLRAVVDCSDYLAGAVRALSAAGRGPVAGGMVGVFDVLEAVLRDVEASAQGRASSSPPIPSGCHDLDRAVRVQGGQLVIVAARPGMGKTSLAMQYALGAARAGVRTLVFSHEMTPGELMLRLLGGRCGVSVADVRDGRMPDGAFERMLVEADAIAGLPLRFNKVMDLSADDVCAEVHRQHAEAPVGLVVIDYLQLLRRPDADRADLAIGQMTRALKLLAVTIGAPVVLLSQLNRGCESRPDKRPLMSDLRESGSIEQDADVILMIYRDEVYNQSTKDRGVAEVIARKVRAGAPGTVRLGFDGARTAFHDLVPYAPPERADEEAPW